MSRLPGPVRAVGALARRVVVPEWVDVLRDLSVLRQDRAQLLDDVGFLRGELAALQGRIDALDADLDESRRLSARVAEVTDLVTEVVLPLHQREVDISRLRPPEFEPD